VMSKLKSRDKKLEYQITKLLRVANQEKFIGFSYTASKSDVEDPFSLKPRPEGMAKSLTTDDITRNQETGKIMGTNNRENIYKPVKMSETLMDEDKKTKRDARLVQARQRRWVKNSFLKDMNEEINDLPTENNANEFVDPYERKKDEAKTAFEEENFIRLPVKKQEKKKLMEKKRKLEGGVDMMEGMDEVGRIVREEFMSKEERERENAIKMKKSVAAHYLKKKEKAEKPEKPDYGDKPRKKFRRNAA